MFGVRWLKSVKNEDRYFTTMCIPEAEPIGSRITPQNEPWVFAKYVAQCFFITDPTRPSHVVVRRGEMNIVGMVGVTNEEDFDQCGNPKEEDDNYDKQENTTRRSRTTLPRTGRPFKRINPSKRR